MKKFLSLILAVVAIFCLFACGNNGWKSQVTDYSGEVSSNGGFAVVKGDYVYFINGIEANTADNKFGTPVKGALVRVKTADLGTANAAAQVVVPKLFYSEVTSGKGFYILGDYVYYTSPSTDKNKAGETLNSKLQYVRTKLDGTDTKVILQLDNLTTPYRYVKSGDNVYLVVYTTVDGENVLVSYNAATGDKVATSQGVTSYIFSDDLAKDYCYYVEVAHNETLDKDESFHNVRTFNFATGADEIVLSGNKGTQGVTFSLIKDTGAELYYSETFVDTSVNTVVNYYGVKENKFNEAVVLNHGTKDAATIFAANSYYHGFDSIIYHDATYGFVKYNYTLEQDSASFGHEYLVSDRAVIEELAALTVKFYENGYVYLTDSSNFYYRVNLEKLAAGEVTVEQITYIALTETWYRPEIIGEYVLASIEAKPFGSYVYAIKMGLTEDQTEDDKLDSYDFAVKANVEAFKALLIGVETQADKDVYNTYLTDTFKDEE